MEIVVELCCNHLGSITKAKQMIDIAAEAGCDYIKLQKRQLNIYADTILNKPRESPFGTTYGDYRYAVEFDNKQYHQIDWHCLHKGIKWFATPMDVPSLKFLSEKFAPQVPFIKIASSHINHWQLLEETQNYDIPIILSTGMSSWKMIDEAISIIGRNKIYCIMHCVGAYPASTEQLNLSCIPEMKARYPWTKIGYSNHHPGIVWMLVAAALGAEMIEFHMTLDRSMYGSDQAASIEPEGVRKLCKYLHELPNALGSPDKIIHEFEHKQIERLRVFE